ncbi:DMT family transporter [Janibacter indicus]|uniref:DMT family transporter n=1 Tax=Janibacter indicus TaxID=857417 RepID=UPI003EBD9BAA
MSWLVLVVSGMLEAVWAAALSASHGFTRLRPTLLFLVALALSMGGLALAVRTIPIGTGYAVWTGVGAAPHGHLGDGHRSRDLHPAQGPAAGGHRRRGHRAEAAPFALRCPRHRGQPRLDG